MARIAVIGLVGKSMFFDVPHFHAGGETVTARGYYEEWGGKGFNQAVAAARQDAAVAFLGACSAEDKKAIEDFCRAEGIVARLCAKRRPTACAAILTDGTGETRVTVYPGAELEVKDVDGFAGSIATADFLLLNNEVPEEVNLAAVEIAKQYGVKIIFNPAPARRLPKAILEAVSIFRPNEFEEKLLAASFQLSGSDCVVPSALKAKSSKLKAEFEEKLLAASFQLSGNDCVVSSALTAKSSKLKAEFEEKLLAASFQLSGNDCVVPSALKAKSSKLKAEVVTTLGAKGCRIRSTGEVIPAPSAKAVDSTGAGDTFSAVLAVRLAEDETLRDACVAANAAAALSVEKRFVMPALPRRRE